MRSGFSINTDTQVDFAHRLGQRTRWLKLKIWYKLLEWIPRWAQGNIWFNRCESAQLATIKKLRREAGGNRPIRSDHRQVGNVAVGGIGDLAR